MEITVVDMRYDYCGAELRATAGYDTGSNQLVMRGTLSFGGHQVGIDEQRVNLDRPLTWQDEISVGGGIIPKRTAARASIDVRYKGGKVSYKVELCGSNVSEMKCKTWEDSQPIVITPPKPLVFSQGDLLWYNHSGWNAGTPDWAGSAQVGHGFGDFAHLFSGGGGILYGVQPTGELLCYRHTGWENGTPEWGGNAQVGHGFDGFRQIFSGGNGVIYGVQPTGGLLWYRHPGWESGAGNVTGGGQVGHGFDSFKHLFSCGGGILYGVVS